MTAQFPFPLRLSRSAEAFSALSLADFAASYPEGAHKLQHELDDHPLFALDALAALRAALPPGSIERHFDDRSAGSTSPGVEPGEAWAVLKNIEQDPVYAALLADLLDELRDQIVARTGRIVQPQGFIVVSNPEAAKPYRSDPRHRILLQLAGEKAITVFAAGDPRFAADGASAHDDPGHGGVVFKLTPGDAVYIPAMAPHHIRTGAHPSTSLSLSWRSGWSMAEADARAFNRLLDRLGLDPEPPGRWPERNTAKAIAWRLARRIPGIVD